MKMVYKNRFRSTRLKCICIVLLTLTFYITISHIFTKPESKREISRNLANVVVHIDFKGSPVKLTYLRGLLPKLKSLGVTGLLLEYEDMFPYEGRLVNLSARNRYSRNELKKFLTYAVHEGFDIIPLVQTFGHLEHALKLPEFQHLREVPFYPDSICPSQLESLTLVHDMLEQVIKFHADIFPLKYFHIGCDEVFHINECQHCRDRRLLHYEIFLDHLKSVTAIINNLTPSTAVLIWDDMFREIPMKLWHIDNTGIEPVYWDYAPTISVSHINMMKYHRKFRKIWIASAFKGADGRMTSFPDLLKRFYNNYGWIRFINNYKFGGENDVYHFEGIILTGWSRYSHMDPPCDLLQVSIPSLFLNLLLIKWSTINGDKINRDLNEIFNEHIHKELMDELNCTDWISLEYFDDQNCNYEGSRIYSVLNRCDNIVSDIASTMNDVDKGLKAFNYYSKFNYVNMNQVSNHVKWCNETFLELSDVERELRAVLSRYYDNFFVEEYVNFKLYETKVMLLNLFDNLQNMLYVETWKRRPFV